jgi:hypothetical protein
MTNDNLLKDIACPKCGYDQDLCVEATTMVLVNDDYLEPFGILNYDGASFAECPDCHHSGKFFEFVRTNQTTNPTSTKEE